MGHQYISEEHLFLALLAEQNLNVLQTLEFLGIDVAQLKTHLMSKLPPADRLTASAVETEEQVESLKRSINAWRNRAEMALQHGKTDLAQVALERKELLEKRLAEIEKEHDS